MDRTQQAKQIATNKLLVEILDERERDIIQAWRSAETVDEREQCATDLRALEALRETISATITGIITGDSGKPRDYPAG